MLIQGRQATPERNGRSQRQLELGQDQNKPEKCKTAFRITFRVTLFFLFRDIDVFSLEILMHIFITEKKGNVESEQTSVGLNHVILWQWCNMRLIIEVRFTNDVVYVLYAVTTENIPLQWCFFRRVDLHFLKAKGTKVLVQIQSLIFFLHIRTVHLDIIKVLFIHQLMH